MYKCLFSLVFCYWILYPMQSSHTVNLLACFMAFSSSFLPGSQSFTYLPANFSKNFKICMSYLIKYFSVFIAGFWNVVWHIARTTCPDSPTWCYIVLGGFYIFPFPLQAFSGQKKKSTTFRSMGFVFQLICEIWWHWISSETAFHFAIREALDSCFLLHDVKGAYSGRSKTDLKCHLPVSLRRPLDHIREWIQLPDIYVSIILYRNKNPSQSQWKDVRDLRKQPLGEAFSGGEEHHGMSELQRPLLIITPSLYFMVEELSNRRKCQLSKYISAGIESGVKPRPLHFLLVFFFFSFFCYDISHTVKLSPQ